MYVCLVHLVSYNDQNAACYIRSPLSLSLPPISYQFSIIRFLRCFFFLVPQYKCHFCAGFCCCLLLILVDINARDVLVNAVAGNCVTALTSNVKAQINYHFHVYFMFYHLRMCYHTGYLSVYLNHTLTPTHIHHLSLSLLSLHMCNVWIFFFLFWFDKNHSVIPNRSYSGVKKGRKQIKVIWTSNYAVCRNIKTGLPLPFCSTAYLIIPNCITACTFLVCVVIDASWFSENGIFCFPLFYADTTIFMHRIRILYDPTQSPNCLMDFGFVYFIKPLLCIAIQSSGFVLTTINSHTDSSLPWKSGEEELEMISWPQMRLFIFDIFMKNSLNAPFWFGEL